MSSTCEVCGSQPQKYKCPNCTTRYCSLACFKAHKPVHDNPSATAPPNPSSSSTSVPKAAPAPQNGPQSASAPPPLTTPAPEPPGDPLQRLLSDPALQALLHKHPTLRTQLHAIYTSTLEPDPGEWAEQQQRVAQQHQNARGGRGGWSRGGRGRGGRGGRGGGMQRPRGPWKQESADKIAVGRILRAQEGEDGEGMREFVELVQRALSDTGREGQGGEDAGGAVG